MKTDHPFACLYREGIPVKLLLLGWSKQQIAELPNCRFREISYILPHLNLDHHVNIALKFNN